MAPDANLPNFRAPIMDDYTPIDSFCDCLWGNDNLADLTIKAYRSDLTAFEAWQNQRSTDLLATSEADIRAWQHHLFIKGIHARSVVRYLSALKRFFGYLKRKNLIHVNPALLLAGPKFTRKLPIVLTEAEVVSLMNVPEIGTHIGLRDKAILELLYATGMRSAELSSLGLSHIDINNKYVKVMGKGGKQRIVVFGNEAKFWMQVYLEKTRPTLRSRHSANRIFITRRGKPISPANVGHIVRKYAERCKFTKPVTPHSLRHAFATHLLNAGADLIVIRDLLGHACVSSTQIYTHVSIARLKQVHAEHHPRENSEAFVVLTSRVKKN
jgi:integrase/recombinase XerD